jgi:hypothetical protein
LATFEEISDTCSDEFGVRASGLLTQMTKFDTFFAIRFGYMVFAKTENLATALQTKSVTIGEALMLAKATQAHLEKMRGDTEFREFYSKVVTESSNVTETPVLPRRRRAPKRLDSGSAPHVFLSPEERFRSIYREVLDLVVNEVARRFDQSSFAIPLKIEELLLNAANAKYDSSKPFDGDLIEVYKDDINFEKLNHQLALLSDFLNEVHAPKEESTLYATVRAIAEELNRSSTGKCILNQVYALVKIYMTIPALLFCSPSVEDLPEKHNDSSAIEQLCNHELSQRDG